MTETGIERKITNNAWIQGCTEWIEEHVKYGGWIPYYINFMFDPLPGSQSAVLASMKKGIVKFYGRFCTEFVHNPRAASEQERLPLFLLFPDKPVWKRNRAVSVSGVKFNAGGLHYNGPMLLPLLSRFRRRGCPIQYIAKNQRIYARNGISRVHIKPIDDILGIGDYAAKTIKWARADEADILILPRHNSELVTA